MDEPGEDDRHHTETAEKVTKEVERSRRRFREIEQESRSSDAPPNYFSKLLRRLRRPSAPDYQPGTNNMRTSDSGVGIGNNYGVINVYNAESAEIASIELARTLFRNSIRDRDRFIDRFLGQALRQANMTFILSIVFMSIGGALVLFAGIMALATAQTTPATNYLLLASGLGGLIVGASGAAFARRADKARKHLAEQADSMQAQLIDERKFNQAGELLIGVKDPTLNDQARIALALKILGAEPPAVWPSDNSQDGDSLSSE